MPEQRTTHAEPMGLESNNQQIIEEQLHYGNDENFSSSIMAEPSQMKLSKSSLRSRWLVLALNCTVMTECSPCISKSVPLRRAASLPSPIKRRICFDSHSHVGYNLE